MFPDHNGIKPEINNRSVTRKKNLSKYTEIKQSTLNNPLVKEEVSKDIKNIWSQIKMQYTYICKEKLKQC